MAEGPARRLDGRRTRSVRSESLVEQVRRRVLEDIIQARLQPGSVIQLGALAEQYGMSRTPVREALTLLERQGLVTAIAYKGYLVRTIEPGDVNDIYFMRRLLEGAAAELAAARIPTERVDYLRALQPPDTQVMTLAYDEYAHEFHYTIAEAAGSPRLLETFETIYNDVRRLQYAGIGNPRPDLIHREHAGIVEALARRDAPAARQRMEEHVAAIRTRALEAWVAGG